MIWDHWIYNPNPYGFLFTLLTRVFCAIGNGHWAVTLGLFKGVTALAYGLAAWLIYPVPEVWARPNRSSVSISSCGILDSDAEIITV